jgi:hypothetical protein
VGAFYFNGDYTLLQSGVFFGSAYTFADKHANMNSAGIYLGPSSQQVKGVTTTSIDTMAYLNLYQTAESGGFGIGLGTRLWASGVGITLRANTTFLALGYKF